jgi:hypothetical protein
MFRSLRGRLMVLLVLLLAAALAAGILMIDLFRQSTTAQAGQAAAEIGRACNAIAAAYRFYSAGWQGPSAELGDEALSRALTPWYTPPGSRRRHLAERSGLARLCFSDL